jgi:2-polyprenyl-6-methoxyphenol hydroxylase-like FAD-dependent oxidoreductase
VEEFKMQHAIVIGASMGGLLAARALADYATKVTVLERDLFPGPRENRKGVPQGRHAHALLPSGREVLEGFFPGLTSELVAQGALTGDSALQVRRCISGYYHCQFRSGSQSLYCSRPMLESHVRARLIALPNVQIIQNCDVLGLVSTDDGQQVTGVRLNRRSTDAGEETLLADLVVDVAGRGSRSPAWLQALGYPAPEEETVQVGVGYVSRIYRRKPSDLQGALNASITPLPPNKRMGVMLAMEDDRWLVTLVGYLGDHPPTDPQGFVEFAKTLPAPDIYEVIKEAEPLSDPLPAKFPASIRRHYETLERFPAGYLVFGDAISSFNPTYGQGMTVAAMEAVALQRCLAQGNDGIAQRFFQAASRLIDIPWQITSGGDLRFAEVKGKRTPIQPLINRYLMSFHAAARYNPALVMAFGRVANLKAAPASLLKPSVMGKVLWTNLKRRFAPAAPARHPRVAWQGSPK